MKGARESKGIDEYILKELDKLKTAYGNSNEGALQDALLICYKYKKLPPDWMFEALGAQGVRYLKGELAGTRPRKRGRPNRDCVPWLRRYRQDMVDAERAETVIECIEHGFAWRQVYEVASKILEGSKAEGKKDAIMASYKTYTKNMKENPWRYLILKTVRSEIKRKPIPDAVLKMKKWGRNK